MKRATLTDFKVGLEIDDFNPRPREEGDSKWHMVFVILRYFNPRPREEGDKLVKIMFGCFANFNPRPREEGDLSEL